VIEQKVFCSKGKFCGVMENMKTLLAHLEVHYEPRCQIEWPSETKREQEKGSSGLTACHRSIIFINSSIQKYVTDSMA